VGERRIEHIRMNKGDLQLETLSILGWRESLRGPGDAYLQASAMGESSAGLFLQKMSEIPRENAAKIYSEVCASTTALQA